MLKITFSLSAIQAFCLAAFLLSYFSICPVYAQNQASPEVISLELNKPVKREFADGGEKHIYQVGLPANQYMLVTIEQQGVDVAANLFGDSADGNPIAQFDSDPRPQGREDIEFIAPNAGNYRLIVTPKYKNVLAGSYQITLAVSRQSSDSERMRLDAHDLAANAYKLYQARKFDDSLAETVRALAALEKSGEAKSFLYALTLKRAGNLLFDKGEYTKAEEYFLRATKVLEDAFGTADARTSDTLNNLAVLYNVTGKYDKSEQLFRQILSNQEKIFGENHPAILPVLNNLGNLYRRQGDYTKAEAMHLRSLAMREKIFGLEKPEVLSALSGLATVYYEKKDFVKARETDERALRIAEKSFPPDDPKLVLYINNLALVQTELGDYAKAEPMFKRALAISEKAYGAEGIDVAGPLNNLGELYAYTGDFDKSNSYYERSLRILEKSLSANHPTIASGLGNIAANYLLLGEYKKAEPLLQKQLAMRESSLGSEHPDVAKTLNTLARLYENEGDAAQALDYQTRADKLLEQYNTLNIYAGSERQMLAYFDYLAQQTDQLITMQSRFADNYEARKLAATAVLQRKGRVQDILTDSLETLRRRSAPEEQKLLSDLSEINAQLAEVVTGGLKKGTQAESQEKIKTLTARKENLEGEISRLNTGFYKPDSVITFDAVAAGIPSDAALVEFVVYRPFHLQASTAAGQYEKPRYAVYVINQKGSISFTDIGDAQKIDESVSALRKSLRDPKSRDVQKLARALDAQIMQPVRAFLGDSKRLLMSPDGALNLIPFEALVDEQNRYLIENYSFTYLTSGRDLLRMKTARSSKSKSLLIANPLFGNFVSERTAAAVSNNAKTPAAGRKGRSITATRSLSDTYFAPLSGTVQEARSIQTLFPDTVFLSGAQATETALKKAVAPQILHIATHGFFLEDNDRLSGTRSAFDPKGNSEFENPLLRSGLALAGANEHKAEGDDGILTALEASGLNLWGTKLVVLSACDTGLGEVKNGEGVYGLRRAFVLAGAETLVMSLWSVSDYLTREPMTNYYKNLKQGMGRGTALREVQLEMLKRKGREHPFYWAAFIQSGEWANLDGRR